MGSFGLGLLGAGLSGLIGSLFSSFSRAKDREHDLEMWQRENWYNSPLEQMKRLEAAGINPNSVVGHGSIVGNTSSSAPRSNLSPTLDRFSGVLSSLNAYADLRNKAAQNEHISAQTRNLDMNNKLMQAQTAATYADIEQTRVNTRSGQRQLDIETGKAVGAFSNDPWYYRLGTRIWNALS